MEADSHHPQPALAAGFSEGVAVQDNAGNSLRSCSEQKAFCEVNSQKRTAVVSRQTIALNVRQAPKAI